MRTPNHTLPDLGAPPRASLLTLLVVALTGLSPRFAVGHDPLVDPPIPPAWAIDSFVDDAGLRGRFVLQMVFDDDGSAWMATAVGLFRYDGYEWQRFSVADGLPSDLVRSICRARDGRLWIGTDRGVVSFDGERFEELPQGHGLAGPNVRRIVEDPDGTLWFCSDLWLRPEVRGGLSRWRNGEWTVYGTDDGLPDEYVSDYFRDSRGRQFVLTRSGFAVKRGDRWVQPPLEPGLSGAGDYAWSIAESPEAGILVTTQRTFFVLKDGVWSAHPNTDPGLVYPKLTALRDGTIVTMSYEPRKAFLRWNGSGFEPATASVHAPGSVEFLIEAPDGSVWCCGLDVLLRWNRRGEWTSCGELPTPRLVDASGRLWCADGDGVSLISPNGHTRFAPGPRDLVAGLDDAVWGWSARGVVRFDDGEPRHVDRADTGLREPRGACLDGRGTMWVYGETDDGTSFASCDRAGTWRRVAAPTLADGAVRRCQPDPHDGVWLLVRHSTSPDRVVHLNGDGIARTLDPPDEVLPDTCDLYVDRKGGVWLFGQAGLFRAEDDGWRRVDALPGRAIVGMAETEAAIWVAYTGLSGGRSGLSRLHRGRWRHFDVRIRPTAPPPRSSRPAFAGPGMLYRIRGTTPAATLAPLTLPAGVSCRVALPADDGVCWVGTTDETVLRYQPDGVPPQTLLVRADAEVTSGSPLFVSLGGRERFRPEGSGRLEFSWRVDGGPWTPFAATSVIDLALDLEPGDHALEVRSRDEGLDIDPTPARHDFVVLPMPLQARPWFRPTAASLFLLLAALGMISLLLWSRARSRATDLEVKVEERTSALRASEQRFRGLVENATDAFLLHEPAGRIIEANPQACVSLGYTHAELVGRSMGEIEHGWTRTPGRVADRPTTRQTTHRRRDGSTFPVETRSRFIEVHGRQLVLALARDVTERRQAEERQRLMMDELDHRVKNNLAAVLALAEQTASTTGSREEFLERFRGRILAMARTHEALSRRHWHGADLAEVIRLVVEPFARDHPDRITLEGEEAILEAPSISALGLALHELTTNAAKYGALSSRAGRLVVRWTHRDRQVRIDWIERDGPPVTPPTTMGFGITLVRGLVEQELGGAVELAYPPEGLVCRISVPI